MDTCVKCKSKNISIKTYKRANNTLEKTYICQECYYTESLVLSDYDYKTGKRTVLNYIKNILWFLFIITFMYTAHAAQKAVSDKKFIAQNVKVVCKNGEAFFKWNGYFISGLRKAPDNVKCEGNQ